LSVHLICVSYLPCNLALLFHLLEMSQAFAWIDPFLKACAPARSSSHFVLCFGLPRSCQSFDLASMILFFISVAVISSCGFGIDNCLQHKEDWLALGSVVLVSISNILFWLCVKWFMASKHMAECVICGIDILPTAYPGFKCHWVHQDCVWLPVWGLLVLWFFSCLGSW